MVQKRSRIYFRIIFLFLTIAFIYSGCANAGRDKKLYSNTKVILDASSSKAEFGGKIVRYKWKQISGKKVKINNKFSKKANFIAPKVKKTKKLVFELTTIEKGGSVSPFKSRDRVRITILPTKNKAPIAVIKADKNITYVNETINFYGDSSYDSDGNISSYEWKYNGSIISNKANFEYSFKTPGVKLISLKVIDNSSLSSKSSINIIVKAKSAPTAKIEANATSIYFKESISLNGSKSSDLDGEIVSYRWYDENNNTLSNEANFIYTPTKVGKQKIFLEVIDNDNLKNKKSLDLEVMAKLEKVTIGSKKTILDINETTNLNATANYNDNSTKDITNSVTWQKDNENINISNSIIKALKYGNSKVWAKFKGIKSNEILITIKKPITLNSIKFKNSPIYVRKNGKTKLEIVGIYSDGSNKELNKANFEVLNSNLATVEDNFVVGVNEGNTTIKALFKNKEVVANLIVNKELNTSNIDVTDFANNYKDLIPPNATKTQYDKERFAMINGLVVDEDSNPLSGVKVVIYNHPEYGSVTTKDNGSFVIPVEGGLKLTLRYTKDGYSTVDRELEVKVQEWNTLPKVMMLQEDSKVTQIDLNSSKIQVHISSPTVDDRGERKATLVFDGVSKATVRSSDGTVRELRNFSVRATEFKTPESMPGELPKTSAYTYCVDMKVDGISDNERVDFDAPVVVYVENFLGFDVGEIVPSGYYDRKQGKWVGSKNGVVVELLDTNNDGLVDALDSNGDGKPDDLNGNGDFSDEVAGIADKSGYSAGKTYWRVEITHFTPWDFNWPWGPAPGSKPPLFPNAKPDTKTPPLSCKANIDSSVDFKARVLHEDIPIAGTDITLHYTSNRVAGKKYIIESDYNATDTSSNLYAAYATLSVAGKEFKQDIEQGRVNKLKFIWDGKDALGKYITGKVTATLTIHYFYDMVMYSASSDFAQAWAQTGSSATDIIGREKIEYTSSQKIDIEVQKGSNKNSNIANGWSFSNVNRLETNRVYKGNGEIVQKTINIDKGLIVYYKFDGNVRDSSGNSYDGVLFGELQYKEGIIGQSAVFNGTQHIKTPIELIGVPENQYITISLWGKSKSSQNTTFITNANIGDRSNSITLSSSSVGIVGRFNGYWSDGFCYKYKLINITNIESVKTDPCGNTDNYETIYDYGSKPIDYTKWHHYVITYDNLYERIYIDGVKVIEKELEPNMIGGPNKIPKYPRDDNDYDRFLNIGQYNNAFNYSEGYVQKTRLVGEIDDLRIYKKVLSNKEIKAIYNYGLSGKSDYDIHGIKISDYNLEYIFDGNGKHLATYSFPSHKLLEKFTYDNDGNLVKITDRFNQSIEIIRDSSGKITQIIAPNGQVTNLSIDENNNLSEVSYEDGSKYSFSYSEGSLLSNKIKKKIGVRCLISNFVNAYQKLTNISSVLLAFYEVKNINALPFEIISKL